MQGGWDAPKPSYKRAKEKEQGPSPPRRGLEPIWDNNSWEVITPPSPVDRRSPAIRSVLDQEAARMDHWKRVDEECAEITAACIAAGGDDPFGGW